MNGWNTRPNYGDGRGSNYDNRSERSYGGYGQTGHSRGGEHGYERSMRSNDGGDYENFPNRGSLFPMKQKRSDNSPDMNGYLTMTGDVLDYVIREAERGEEIRLELSAWIRMSRNNQQFTSLAVNIPYNVRQAEQGNSTYRARPNFNQRQMERPNPQRQSAPPRQNVRQSYAEQSGRDNPPPDRNPLPRYGGSGGGDPDFQRGDRMPAFTQGQRDRDRDPNAPPF